MEFDTNSENYFVRFWQNRWCTLKHQCVYRISSDTSAPLLRGFSSRLKGSPLVAAHFPDFPVAPEKFLLSFSDILIAFHTCTALIDCQTAHS